MEEQSSHVKSLSESNLNDRCKVSNVLIKEEYIIDDSEDSLSCYENEQNDVNNTPLRLECDTTMEETSSADISCENDFNAVEVCNVLIREESIVDDSDGCEDSLLYNDDIEQSDYYSEGSVSNEPQRKISVTKHKLEYDKLSSQSPCVVILDSEDESCEYNEEEFTGSVTKTIILPDSLSYLKPNHHKAKKKEEFQCSMCPHVSESISKLAYHMRVHSKSRPFKCTYCEYSASTRGTLQQHTRLHTGEKPYKCTQCNFTARQKCALELHLRHHSGEKPFKCIYCDYSAFMKGTLKQHLKMHTVERLHKCPLCNYSSARSSTVLSHMSLHSGHNVYKCTYCNYSTHSKHVLTQHVRRHTGEKSNSMDETLISV